MKLEQTRKQDHTVTQVIVPFGPHMTAYEFDTPGEPSRAEVYVFQHDVTAVEVEAMQVDTRQTLFFKFTTGSGSIIRLHVAADGDLLDSLAAQVCGEQWAVHADDVEVSA